MMTAHRWRPDWILVVLLGLSGAANVYLASALSRSRAQPGELKVGSKMPDLLVGPVRFRNAPVDSAIPSAGWVVYFFSPRCEWCRKNSASLETLNRSLPAGWRLIAVSLDENGLDKFIDDFRVTVPVVSRVRPESVETYRVLGTPRTYLLNRDWALLEVLGGAYTGAVAERLRERFNVSLDLSNAPTDSPAALAPASAAAGSSRLCLDEKQNTYSTGARAEILGEAYRCATGGEWAAVVE